MKSAKILIVDDVPENLQVLGQILDAAEYEVSYAMDGQQALDSVAADLPDLVLLDVNMPVMDGYEACTSLKENPETKMIPVIFLTAKTESEDIVKGFDYGAVDYVTKPFQSKELLQRVATHIALKRSREDLERTLNQKNVFFSIIAHDMRTPFNALIGFSNLLLLDGEVSKEDKEQFIKIIHSTSKKGLGLLENLLMWASSQTGSIVIKKEQLGLFGLVEDVKSLLFATAAHKQIEVKNLIEPNIKIDADRQSVNTILRNLISNAIKFTNKNGIIIIQAITERGKVIISINDNGVGMDEQTTNDLFRYDRKVSTKGTNNETGTGLGLLLCKEFAEKNNGSLKVESVLGVGTTFFLTLPEA